jgi:hypothetical protein
LATTRTFLEDVHAVIAAHAVLSVKRITYLTTGAEFLPTGHAAKTKPNLVTYSTRLADFVVLRHCDNLS